MFKSSIVKKVEKQQRLEAEAEILKKQQKVKVESLIKEYANRKAEMQDSLDAQINSYKAQIVSLTQAKKDRAEILDEELKVAIDQVTSDYNQRIVAKQNQAKSLGHYIAAEQKNIEDVINPDQPNAPRKVLKPLNEEVEEPKKTKKK